MSKFTNLFGATLLAAVASVTAANATTPPANDGQEQDQQQLQDQDQRQQQTANGGSVTDVGNTSIRSVGHSNPYAPDVNPTGQGFSEEFLDCSGLSGGSFGINGNTLKGAAGVTFGNVKIRGITDNKYRVEVQDKDGKTTKVINLDDNGIINCMQRLKNMGIAEEMVLDQHAAYLIGNMQQRTAAAQNTQSWAQKYLGADFQMSSSEAVHVPHTMQTINKHSAGSGLARGPEGYKFCPSGTEYAELWIPQERDCG